MSTTDTLSTSQWTALQSLFEQALSCDAAQRERLLTETSTGDPALGHSLAAMLAAHSRWQDHTGDARGDLHAQVIANTRLAIGDMVGPYRIAGLLGEGGMGVVYRAERSDGEVAITVAIKLLQRGGMDAAAHERFRRERDLLAGLSHPHIARLFDAGVDAGGQPYFVMEYVQGATLDRWCDTRTLTVRERLQLFLEVCEAVQYAHSQLVLHRDIKPGNVLVDESGVAKLIDFGIAKSIGLGQEQMLQTATAQRYFSPSNVAPEQLEGERVGVACDVYQLGTLLYELLCGRPVFDFAGMTLGTIEKTIRHQVPLSPSVRARGGHVGAAQARGCADPLALARQLAGDLDEIALMALRKEPGRRYASVEQLVDDVQRHLDLQPVRARGSSRGYRTRLFAKRHWRSLALGTAAVLAVIAFVAALTLQSRELQRERDRAVTQQHRAESEQHRAEEATQFLVNVFKAADPKVSMNRNTPIGDVLESGRRKLDTELADQPLLKADLMFALAQVELDIGSLPQALAYSKQALDLRERLVPASSALASSLDQVASLDVEANDCKSAVRIGAEAMALYRKFGTGVTTSGELQEALIVCEGKDRGEDYVVERIRALLVSLEHDPQAAPPQIAGLEMRLMVHVLETGNLTEGIRLCESAASRLDRSAYRHSPEALDARLCVANDLMADRQQALAAAKFSALAPEVEQVYGRSSVEYVDFLGSRAANFGLWGRTQEAEADLLEARHTLLQLQHEPSTDQVDLDDGLATTYEQDPGRRIEAGAYLEEALRNATALAGIHDPQTLKVRYHHAVWLALVGRNREAETELRALEPELPISGAEGLATRIELGGVLVQLGRQADAEAVLAACEAAIDKDKSVAYMKVRVARARKGVIWTPMSVRLKPPAGTPEIIVKDFPHL